MNCLYCGTDNDPADHRCHRCGRRLSHSPARPAPDVYPTAGARALAAEAVTQVANSSDRHPEPVPERPTRRRSPYQPALFTTRDLGRVVPIEAYQVRPEALPGSRRGKRPGREPQSPDGSVSLQQQTFQFAAATARAKAVAEPLRYTKAPVATATHRVLAAVLDQSLVMVAVGITASVIHTLIQMFLDAEFLSGNTLPFFGGLAVFFTVGYKLMWAMSGMESPGVKWAQLRLLNFDGLPATRQERWKRLAWSCLSVLPAGFGLLWALVDEEALSLHDHCSKTFYTSRPEDPRGR